MSPGHVPARLQCSVRAGAKASLLGHTLALLTVQSPAFRQELYQWPSVAEAGRRALGLRYRLLTYMYYHFDRAAAAGAPIARPLWFEFPADAAARAADSQWLLGDSVLVSPVLEQARQLPSSALPCACLASRLCSAACSPR